MIFFLKITPYMKKSIYTLLLCLVTLSIFAQGGNVGIGTSTPDPSAILDLGTTSKGLGMPILTTIQRDLIPSPKLGLTIYNTTDSCLQTWTGTQWKCNSITIINNITQSGGGGGGSCEYCLHVDTILLTEHQINFLGDTPVNLILPPGPGKYISLQSVAMHIYPGSIPFSYGGEIKFFFDPMCWSNLESAMQGLIMNTTIETVSVAQKMQPQYLNGMDDQGFWIKADYNPFMQTGNGHAKITIAYYILPI